MSHLGLIDIIVSASELYQRQLVWIDLFVGLSENSRKYFFVEITKKKKRKEKREIKENGAKRWNWKGGRKSTYTHQDKRCSQFKTGQELTSRSFQL